MTRGQSCVDMVKDLFINVLKREPTRPTEQRHYVETCRKGRTGVNKVLKMIIDSDEFKKMAKVKIGIQ